MAQNVIFNVSFLLSTFFSFKMKVREIIVLTNSSYYIILIN